MLQYTVRLNHQVFAITHFDLFADNRIDKGQVGQFPVEEVRQCFEDLSEGGFLDEHPVEDSVARIGVRILFDASARIGTVGDIHREKQIIHQLFAVHFQHHVFGFMLHYGGYQSEQIIHMMAADIVFQCLGFLAGQRIYAEAYRVDEIVFLLHPVAAVADASHIYRHSLPFKKTAETLFVILGQSPVPSPVVACAAGHKPELDPGALGGIRLGGHYTVHRLAQCAVAA